MDQNLQRTLKTRGRAAYARRRLAIEAMHKLGGTQEHKQQEAAD
jgi:hypothetical protein